MKEYQELIDKYSVKGYESYSNTISQSEWGNVHIGEQYLQKHWLSRMEYESTWKYIQNDIFVDKTNGLPELIFLEEFNLIGLRGGTLLDEETYRKLQKCMYQAGTKYWFVIQNVGRSDFEPIFRMKYSVDCSWDELMSGNFVSSILFEMCHHDYFVFGDSANWGMYAGNDFESPLRLFGFKSELAPLFRENLIQTTDEWSEIKDWIPSNYKSIVLPSDRMHD